MRGASPKKPRRRRRSELRMGVPSISYETTKVQPRLSLSPVITFWKQHGSRLVSGLLLLLLGIGLYILFSSPTFFIYNADIRGNAVLSSAEIYKVSGLDSQSIFWINAAESAERITELPNIKLATVSIALPAQVIIEVVERKPAFLWQTGETVWWVDQEGLVVPPKENINGMLRIIDDDQHPLEVGYQMDQTIVEGAQALHLLVPDVSIMRYSRSRGLIVSTPEGWPVFLGDGSEIKAKLVVLTTILSDLETRNIEPLFVDIRNPLRPVYQPKSVIQIDQNQPPVINDQ